MIRSIIARGVRFRAGPDGRLSATLADGSRAVVWRAADRTVRATCAGESRQRPGGSLVEMAATLVWEAQQRTAGRAA